jgi:AhpD family alkylhydroperoxidase
MNARIPNPAQSLPGALQSLLGVGKAVHATGLSPALLAMVELRASQINSCSLCVDMHAQDLVKNGGSEQQARGVAAWRESPYFDDRERAALALSEADTRLSDREDAVPDPVWDAAAAHFDESELAGLVTAIALVNLWNRINAATRQPAGSAW